MDDTILRNKKKQVLYASALFLVIISFLLDDFFRLVFLRLHNGFFQAVFSLFSNISIILFFLFFLTAAMLRIRKDHKWVLAMIASILVTFVVTYYLKFFFARPRPNGGVIRTLFGLTDYSFPSFHTSLL
ncbi:hypothetical protein GOV05_05235, partial [Candidatus Woesearchaeota archaeon]|nr:hypothetical protein [Candidatus Woesearchaeota archaeon]